MASRIAALEAKLLPPPEHDFNWIQATPLAADEEYVITREERYPNGWCRTIEKRKKQQ